MNSPFFLAGIDRSGIGLLGELLETHPDIAVTRRLNFWSFYNDRYGDLADPANLDQCLADMMRYTRISRLQPDVELWRHDFLAGEASYARLFALLQEQNMHRLGKRRWADKSLNAEGEADIILDAFPKARMIHIIRDPRDRYASQLTHRGRRKGKIGGGTALWLWSARLAERNARRFSGRYKVVRYEDMVRQPEAFLRDICAFIGQEYSSLMLSVSTDSASVAQREFFTTSIGRYPKTLSASDVAFTQKLTARHMDRYGYEAAPVPMGALDKIAFYGKDMPLNLARLTMARWQSTYRDRKGRGPSARRLRRAPASPGDAAPGQAVAG